MRIQESAENPRPFAFELPGRCFDFDRQGGLWTFTDDGVIRRLDLSSGRVDRFVEPLPLEGVRTIAVSPDGDRVLVAGAPACAFIRDPFGEFTIDLLGVPGIAAAAFDPTGIYLAMAHSEEGLLVANGETQEPLWGEEFIASQSPVLRFTDKPARVAVNTCEAVQIYDLESGESLHRIELFNDALFTYAATAGFETILMAGQCGARLCSTSPEEAEDGDYQMADERTPGERVLAICWEGPDRFICTNSDGRIYRLIEGEPFRLFECRARDGDGAQAVADILELSHDGRFAVSLWSDGKLRVLPLQSNGGA